MAQGVPQGTVLGPLLFDLYVNDLSNFLSCETIQYADDTVLLSSHDEILKCKDELERAIEKCIQFFNLHHLKINPDKTEFIIFGSSNPQNKTTLKVGDKLISSKAEIKYLGFYIDKDLKNRKQVKILLSKMAHGINCIYALGNIVPTVYKKPILNSFVLSHVQYSSVLPATINQNLITTLEKQLNWAIKACFHRQKFDSSSDLKMKLGILPISLLFDYRAATYCHGIMNKKETCLLKLSFEITNRKFLYTRANSKKFLPRQFQNAICMKKVLLKEVFCSTILSQEIICQYHTVLQRRNISCFFLNEYKKDPKKNQYGSITWKHFKFN